MSMTRAPELTATEKSRAVRLAPNWTAAEIAERLDKPVSQIRRYLKKVGITPKRGHHAPLAGVDLEAEIAEEGSVQAVADYYGVTRQAIYDRLKKMTEE